MRRVEGTKTLGKLEEVFGHLAFFLGVGELEQLAGPKLSLAENIGSDESRLVLGRCSKEVDVVGEVVAVCSGLFGQTPELCQLARVVGIAADSCNQSSIGVTECRGRYTSLALQVSWLQTPKENFGSLTRLVGVVHERAVAGGKSKVFVFGRDAIALDIEHLIAVLVSDAFKGDRRFFVGVGYKFELANVHGL